MSLTFGFYNSDAQLHDRKYTAEEFSRIFDGIISDGVYAHVLSAMRVESSILDPTQVLVNGGRAWFNNTWTYIDVPYPISAEAPEVVSGNNRLDALVIDIDKTTRTNQLAWVKGTPLMGGSKTTLVKPTLADSEYKHQHPLCYVIRYGGINSVTADDIINVVGTSECPYVTGILQSISADQLLSNLENDFVAWNNQARLRFDEWMVQMQSDYNDWFATLQDQLDDNQAGNLLTLIQQMNQTSSVTKELSTTNDNVFVFTNQFIHGTSMIQPFIDDAFATYNYKSIEISENRCVITYPPYTESVTCTVKIQILNI